ncbi:Sodium/calcium exchanger protein-domain-containing protein [Corynascus novoguineensis]|uniref:Sodium/calcium exchanger protein-domain-containing protein n=1 Tax=Corynascus novoguineensis TaxID=1126955 RepID=A0AAN7HH28_9PEZI|nr:Sodium/calcium exchanger protein-domain-containing protein [Corynascus novoguineensis]
MPRSGQGASPSLPRKPSMMRRASSNAQAPYRGGVYSVDDDIAEVEADAAERQQSYAATRRRRAGPPPALARIHSRDDGDDDDDDDDDAAHKRPDDRVHDSGSGPADEARGDASEAVHPDDSTPVNDDGDISDAESFTLKDRQQAINQTHPFGIRLWKPALYKKSRSVQKNAEGDIHSSPGGHVSTWLLFFNILWTLAFGWWMALIAFSGAIVCFFFAAAPGGRDYGRILWGLAAYLFYPFGKFVRLEQQEAYLDEDQGEGRSISEYEQWQNGDLEYGRLFFGPDRNRSIIGRSRRSLDSEPDETESLLGRGRGQSFDDDHLPRMKRRLFGRGEWNIGRVVFFAFFYFLITPSLFIVSAICWFLVFTIPMGKVTMLLFSHLRRHPLALSFESDIASARAPAAPHSSILVCTYRAVGLKYWKYTIDGTNVFLINLMAVVCFVIFDWLVLDGLLHMENFFTSSAFLFTSGLLSVIPLAYFIGQAVASISAQSSMGLGAAINAFFSTVVEVFLYCVALQQGKAQLVEGSIIGSVFAGILFLPGLSMCFGAIKRKTQRFNSKSAGVTSTMLLFAVIGAFSPTLFYQIYGTHELTCQDCLNVGSPNAGGGALRDCRRCYFSQTPALSDRFYIEAVRPYCYLAAGTLFLAYVIGLWFTLRTHAAVIWNTEIEEKKHEEHHTPHPTPRPLGNLSSAGEASGVDIRDSHLYKRILGQSLQQVGQYTLSDEETRQDTQLLDAGGVKGTPHVVPPKPVSYGTTEAAVPTIGIPGLTDAQNSNLVQQVAEIAATAATVAARNVQASRRGPPGSISTVPHAHASGSHSGHARSSALVPGQDDATGPAGAQADSHGGHDAPNWSRLKSSIILMCATVLYAIVAEILVDTVDVVLESFDIDEKFLGITLFALVPNTTEFLNAISFAMNGNIALSMEIGSAYALQVCLLQVPALVLFSAVNPVRVPAEDAARYTFSLLFPQWDMVTVIMCVFLLSYVYSEGKSNYFKGSILLLSYMVVIVGFYSSGFGTSLDDPEQGVSRFDTLGTDGQWMSYNFKTIGRGFSGTAY